jgi:hypothetical protein
MSYTIKNLKKAERVLIGIPIPKQQFGNNGRFVEDILEENGYPINRKNGPDLKDLEVEIKTRDIDATSAQTVGKMAKQAIIKYSWKESSIFKKFQQQFRVHYSSEQGIIIDASMYDFRLPEIQAIAEQSYEAARQKLKDGDLSNYVRGEFCGDQCWGFFERTDPSKPDFYDFRFSDRNMKKLEALAKSEYKNLFE